MAGKTGRRTSVRSGNAENGRGQGSQGLKKGKIVKADMQERPVFIEEKTVTA